MKKYMVRFALSAMICVGWFPLDMRGQTLPVEPDTETAGVHYMFVPAFAYTSDLGFVGGGLGQRIDYGDGVSPFLDLTQLTFTASTKGLISSRIRYDRTRSLNRSIRSTFDLRVERFFNQNYFGVGNHTGFRRSLWDEEHYFYEHREVKLDYTARTPLEEWFGDERLDLLFTYGLIYNSPKVAGEDSFYAADRPFGRKGGWIHEFGTGLVFENRENEFDPRNGSRYEFRVSAAPSGVSDYGFGRIGLNTRHYIPLFHNVILAHQFDVRMTSGDLPFWALPKMGSEDELRGYAENRFRGQSRWFSLTEVRAWVLEFPDYDLKFGLHFFWDAGRVYSERDSIEDSLSNLKHTFGVGGSTALFSPDLIFRGEVGFSDEMYRIYIGIGYLF
ncbi:MAG: BamA/TamA family outer membrane protein [Balneolaceae bacterium]